MKAISSGIRTKEQDCFLQSTLRVVPENHAHIAIDVGFLAVLSNHLHLVIQTSPRLVKRMGSWEVARRWLRVYPGHRVLDANWNEPSEDQVRALAQDKNQIETIRKRLSKSVIQRRRSQVDLRRLSPLALALIPPLSWPTTTRRLTRGDRRRQRKASVPPVT